MFDWVFFEAIGGQIRSTVAEPLILEKRRGCTESDINLYEGDDKRRGNGQDLTENSTFYIVVSWSIENKICGWTVLFNLRSLL